MGTEVIADSTAGLTIQVLLSFPELSVENALRRMFLIAASMHRDAMLGVKWIRWVLMRLEWKRVGLRVLFDLLLVILFGIGRARKMGGNDRGKLLETPRESPFRNPHPVPFGGHGLVSTAADFLRFAQMLANAGEVEGVRLLRRETVDLMIANHLGPEFGPRTPRSARRLPPVQSDGHRVRFRGGGAVTTDAAEESFHGSAGTFSWGGNGSTYFWSTEHWSSSASY